MNRKNLVLYLSIIFFLCLNTLYGQNVLKLKPYDGTESSYIFEQINSDIALHGGLASDRVYELEGGAEYRCKQTFTLYSGLTLRLRSSNDIKPIIYMCPTGTGTTPLYPPAYFITLNGGDLEMTGIALVGIYEPNLEALDYIQAGMIRTDNEGSRIILHDCVFSEVAGQIIRTESPVTKIELQNCILTNMGALTTSNLGEGKAIDLRQSPCDSLILINNTFTNYQDRVIRHYNFADPTGGTGTLDYCLIDHNTFYSGMGFHGLLSLGTVGTKVIITNNFFVDAFAAGEDMTDATRTEEWANTGETYLNGLNKMSWIFCNPNTTTEWEIHNNDYAVSTTAEAFYTANPPIGIGSPLSLHIQSRMGAAAAANAFKEIDNPGFKKSQNLMINLMNWYVSPTGGNKTKNTPIDTWDPAADDMDRRPVSFWTDTLNLAYSSTSTASTDAEGSYPVGDLSWYPDLLPLWESGKNITDIDWSSSIVISDNTIPANKQTIVFGVAPSATDRINPSLGEYDLPSIPPSGTFDVRFEINSSPNEYSLKDFRNSVEDTVLWKIKFQPGGGGYPVKVSWDNSNLPAGDFILKDVIDGTLVNFDMKQKNSIEITDYTVKSLEIHYSNIRYVDIDLKNGWNLISVPLKYPNMSTTLVFPNYASEMISYQGEYTAESSLENGKGYWLKNSVDETLNTYGYVVKSSVISVNKGWNIIGVHNLPQTIDQLITEPEGIINAPVYGYSNGYFIADTLKPGKGYWVRASEAGTINLTGSANTNLIKSNNIIAKTDSSYSPAVSIPISITDNAGGMQTLYFGADSTATDSIDLSLGEQVLPPAPPNGVFDARFILSDSAGASLRDYRQGTSIPFIAERIYEIQYQAGSGTKININWNLPTGVTGTLKDVAYNGLVINESISDSGSYEVIDPVTFNKVIMTIDYNLVAIPQPPQLVSPEDNATDIELNPVKLTWLAGANIESYTLLLSTDASFETSVSTYGGLIDTTYSITGLKYGTKYYWKVKAENIMGESEFSDVRNFTTTITGVEETDGLPKEYALYQNYPNPFNPATVIKYSLPYESRVNIRIYNILGQEVKRVVYDNQAAGYYQFTFNGANLSSGIYIYSLEANAVDGKNNFRNIKKMILMK